MDGAWVRPSTIANDVGVLERTLVALDRPVWEVTAADVDRVVGELARAGRAVSTRRDYLQVFRGFHRFLQVRKAAEIEAAFGVRLACPVDEFNAARHVNDDSPARRRRRRRSGSPRSSSSSGGGSRPRASTRQPRGITRCSARCITLGCGPRRW